MVLHPEERHAVPEPGTYWDKVGPNLQRLRLEQDGSRWVDMLTCFAWEALHRCNLVCQSDIITILSSIPQGIVPA